MSRKGKSSYTEYMTDHNPNALKHLYGEEFLKRMAEAFSCYAKFDVKAFFKIKKTLFSLEMKPRVLLIRDELHRQLPPDFPRALKWIMKAHKSGKMKGFDYWPLTEYIQLYGLEHSELSLDALKEITIPFTGEFAVRPFLIKEPQGTLNYLLECARDPHHSVRRWASEGSRPRLPWGMKLHLFIQEPTFTLPILDELKFDPELFVRKSVANHLNDIAKDHPDLVIKTLKAWKKLAKGEDQVRLEWIIRHSLRTLIKEGNPEALKLLGADSAVKVKLSRFSLKENRLRLNERLCFEFEVASQSSKKQKLVIDYRIHFQKAGGKTSPKVFKLKTLELAAGGKISICKDHVLRVVTTRKHYWGKHALEILINGVAYKKVEWDLVESRS